MSHILSQICTFLDHHKTQHIVTIDVSGRSDTSDYIVIASGRSSRQIKSVAQLLSADCKEKGITVLGIEDTDWWVLMDLGEVVVHIMLPDARKYYELEKLWSLKQRELVSHET